MSAIESRSNAKFKAWCTLLDGRGIKKAGRALISGRKLVDEFLARAPELAEDLLVPPKGDELVPPAGVRVHHLSSPLFRELDVMGTGTPLLIVRTEPLADWQSEPPQGLQLIVALSDPGNLGALLRSAEAFSVSRVILTEEACSPFLPKSIRASGGASLRLSLARTGPLAKLQISDAFALDMGGEDLSRFTWPKNLYLLLGEEGRGVPEGLGLRRLSIRMGGHTESLNATTAAAIAMYSYRGQN